MLTALLSALLTTLAGLLVRLLLLLARLLLPATALLTTLAALLVLVFVLIGHQITPSFDARNNAALRSSVPNPTQGNPWQIAASRRLGLSSRESTGRSSN